MIQDANATVTCPACLLTFVTTAVSRFQQLWQLTQSKPWKQLHLDQYHYVYLPDGDTYHEVKQIERCMSLARACLPCCHCNHACAADPLPQSAAMRGTPLLLIAALLWTQASNTLL